MFFNYKFNKLQKRTQVLAILIYFFHKNLKCNEYKNYNLKKKYKRIIKLFFL